MVCLVRSEDRKPSRRVFPLLQNLDLDSLTFAQVQGVGEPITIEDMNEQELQDLVLVNLARLAVSAEWTGLLEAGGGGGVEIVGGLIDNPDTYKYWNITGQPPYGIIRVNTSTQQQDKGTFFPWIASQAGDLTGMRMYIATAHTGGSFYAAVYSSNEDTALPETLAGYCTFSTTSTGQIEVTSFSSTITTVKGTTYWLYTNVGDADTATNLRLYGQNHLNSGPCVTGGPFETVTNTESGLGLRYNGESLGVPASSVTTSDLEANIIFSTWGYPPRVMVAWT